MECPYSSETHYCLKSVIEASCCNAGVVTKPYGDENKEKIQSVQRAGLQLPSGLPTGSSVSSINAPTAKVNIFIADQTTARQYSTRFGNGKETSRRIIKIVNPDCTQLMA